MKSSRRKCRRLLKPGGVLLNNARLPRITTADLLFLRQLIEAGRLHPVIDRTYAMADVAEAHRYVDQGHKRGNVGITIP
ncbi:MAG: zinc-binding dehydrogenase [Lewinella sp.]|nr:zinc-binding dehydrogenase [Lewinella sp.]